MMDRYEAVKKAVAECCQRQIKEGRTDLDELTRVVIKAYDTWLEEMRLAQAWCCPRCGMRPGRTVPQRYVDTLTD